MWETEIIEIDLKKNVPGLIIHFKLDSLNKGNIISGYLIPIVGWVMGENEPVKSIHISSKKEDIIIPVKLLRPGVISIYHKDYPWADTSGFSHYLPIINKSGTFDFIISAKIGLKIVEVGRIKIKVRTQKFNISPKFNPIILTSIGRSGSTLCIQAIGNHPNVAMIRTHPYESKIATNLIKSLIEATSINIPGAPDKVAQYLNRDFIRDIFKNYVNYIDDCYEIVAQINRQAKANYYIEKSSPFEFQDWFQTIYPDVKEIILVRDFRDIVCSVLSFNKKRGYNSFGREHFKTDLEYIEKTGNPNAILSAWEMRKEKAILVRYEDLISNKKATLKRIFEYLNIDSSSKIVDELSEITSYSGDNLNDHMTSLSPEESIRRWQNELSSEMLSAANQSMFKALVEFGYEVTR